MSSFLERIRAKMTGSLNKPMFQQQERKRSRHTIATNRWDEMVWTEARKTQGVHDLIYDLTVGDQHKGGERQGWDPAPELIRDLFMGLYKAAPRLLGKREVTKDCMVNRKIMQEILDSPKLAELTEITATDPIMSTIAIESMADVIREIITRVPPPPDPNGGTKKCDGNHEKGVGNCSGGEGVICTHGMGEGGGGAGGDGGGDGDTAAKSPGETGEGAELTDDEEREFDLDEAHNDALIEADERDWEDKFDDLMDDVDIDRLAKKALDEAERETDELEDLRKGIGVSDGEWKTMSPEERLRLANTLNTPNMKALADIIGKMKRFALSIKASRIVDVPHEAYDVEQGNILRRILKSQFVLLGHPDTKAEFYRRYFDKELLQYKMRGREEVGKGPILIGIDKSGSMNGEPFHWAMAVAEALRRFAADEDRDYFAAFFGSNNDRERFDFPKGKAPFEKVLAFLSCQANGGTAFDGILTELLERAAKTFDDAGATKADIVFVTDGMAHLDDEWITKFNEEKARIGVRVYSVYIGGAYDMGYQGGPQALLERFSDGVIHVKELKPEAVEQIFQRV